MQQQKDAVLTVIAASRRSSKEAEEGISQRRAFTLIELLIVIAIIAILSIVVVLSLNPAEMLRQSRDQNRLSDMDTLTHALNLYQADQAIISTAGSLGTINTVYVSLPDPNATTSAGSTCSSLNLPFLPTGYTYHCAGPTYYRTTNGQGWIPINFSSISTGSPLGQLPIDPTNSSSSRLYYTYTTSGSQYEVTTPLESAKYKLGGTSDQIANDGGTLASVYEKGSRLGLEPLDYGDPSLVGLWTFDEGTGTTAFDYSGGNATGSFSSPAPTWTIGQIGSGALSFNGASKEYINVASSSQLDVSSAAYSIVLWAKFMSTPTSGLTMLYEKGDLPLNHGYGLSLHGTKLDLTKFGVNDQSYTWIPLLGTWYNIVAIQNYSGSTPTNVIFFVNGSFLGSVSDSLAYNSSVGYSEYIASACTYSACVNTDATIDDVRVYNRALSAAEISALYAGGK